MVNLIYLLALLIVIVFIRGELIQLIPVAIAFFDTFILDKMRRKIVKELWFATRIKIINKRFKVEQKLFNSWTSESYFLVTKDIERAMNIELNPVLLQSNFDYKFGYLLNKYEKKWLQTELEKRLQS